MRIKNKLKLYFKFILIVLSFFYYHSTIFAQTLTLNREKVINLVISYKIVNLAGKPVKKIAVNNQIPGPTLHFKQGDHVTINVYNRLDQGTTIHWHGLLVPWQMDGVEGVTQEPIPPNGVYHYQFTLYQSGTYWYHAHAGLQEQEGLYGALVIDPPKSPAYQYNKDYVMVLSDFSNTAAEQIYANLKKDGDYYSPRFPLQPSLMKFIHDYRQAPTEERKKLIADYKMMQQMRMSIYDLSDIAYDAYLLNGHPEIDPWKTLVKVGDKVRLRFIGASASTIYRIKIFNGSMTTVNVQGNDVAPYLTEDFTIAPGETHDVLVNITNHIPYIIYAESNDTLGKAYGALVTDPNTIIDYQKLPAFPEPLPVTRNMMNHSMSGMHMSGSMSDMHQANAMSGMHMHHGAHQPSSTTMTTGTKYQDLTAAVPTNDPNIPIYKIIKMDLFGYMDRYIWFINGVREFDAKPIPLEPGKRYRIIFTNSSMMNHPMHIHGHWFILRNGHGTHDPLLHTIEVPPSATVVADVDTDASGQWFFHCHHLYHMVAGMARTFQYSTLIAVEQGRMKPESMIMQQPYINRPIVREDEILPLNAKLIAHPMGHHEGFYFANFIDLGVDPFHNVQEVTFKGLYGRDYHKLQLFVNDAEVSKGSVENADIDIFYWHLIGQFWAIKGGVNYFYRQARVPYWQPGIGIEGLLPYFIETDARAYHYSGSSKLDLELSRDTQITNNFFIQISARGIFASKTVPRAELGSGLNETRFTIRPYYRLIPGLAIFAEYENTQDYGPFKRIQQNNREDTSENTITFGISLIV